MAKLLTAVLLSVLASPPVPETVALLVMVPLLVPATLALIVSVAADAPTANAPLRVQVTVCPALLQAQPLPLALV